MNTFCVVERDLGRYEVDVNREDERADEVERIGTLLCGLTVKQVINFSHEDESGRIASAIDDLAVAIVDKSKDPMVRILRKIIGEPT